ncbi:MAG: PAS domain-containing sensor histidine kinase [Candidatus Methanoperedens sp.]|nr:PAS domain-containing sensor histidine kinase [Candidatus Methanoperedens sp.]
MPGLTNMDILSLVSDAIISITDEDIIFFWNRSAQNLFGWKENEVIGKKLSALAVPPERLAEKAKLEDEVKSGKIITGIETAWLTKNGNPANLILSLILARDKDQNIIGSSYIINNNNETKPAGEALIESEMRLHAMMQSSTDAFIIADKDGTIISTTGVAQNILQYTEQDLKGKPLSVIIPKRYKASHEIGVQRMIATGKANIIGKKVGLFGVRKDGSEFPLELSLNVWNSGKKIFFSAMIGEIKIATIKRNTSFLSNFKKTGEKPRKNSLIFSEDTYPDEPETVASRLSRITMDSSFIKYRRKAEELQSENTRIALAYKAESEFLATISREFRDPLGSIIGFCELLKRKTHGDLEKKQEQYIDTIHKSGKSLITLIDKFELKRTGAEKIHLVMGKIFVIEIINETFNLLKEKALEHNVELTKDIATSFNLINADKKFLNLIFFNLMGNAIDFSSGGSVHITAKEENTMARFSVRGSGWGDIPKKIDDYSVVLDKENIPEFVISKKLVQMHGGKIFSERKDGDLLITFIMPIEVKKRGI